MAQERIIFAGCSRETGTPMEAVKEKPLGGQVERYTPIQIRERMRSMPERLIKSNGQFPRIHNREDDREYDCYPKHDCGVLCMNCDGCHSSKPSARKESDVVAPITWTRSTGSRSTWRIESDPESHETT